MQRKLPEPRTMPTFSDDRARVLYNLTLHRPDADVAGAMDVLRDAFKGLAIDVTTVVPPGRERAMALTAIEDACMYAIAGLARSVPTKET